MEEVYFRKYVWPTLSLDGVQFNFEHLKEFSFVVQDSSAAQRKIVVTFSDHVFTRESTGSPDDVRLEIPTSRHNGCLCRERYRLSRQLPSFIESIAHSKIWCLSGGDRYAQIPVVTENGEEVLYAIVFTLDRLGGLPFDLHLHVRTAYPCQDEVPVTFGLVRFEHLVYLRFNKRHPKKNSDRGRKRPRIGQKGN